MREARGLSRFDLAAACDRPGRQVHADDIRRYEEDGSMPPVVTFAALARALGVSMEALLYGEEEAARIAAARADAPA
jgi:transcriptional regulator with XRE-family HTH domain